MKKQILSILCLLFCATAAFAQQSPETKVRQNISSMQGKRINVLPDASFTNTFKNISDLAVMKASFATLTEFKNGSTDTSRIVILTDPGKEGIFRRVATSEIEDSSVVIARNGVKFKREFEGGINVRWFGAKGDGSTDDSQAIIKARNFIFRSIKADPLGSDRITGYKLYFPAGTYKVTNSEALIPNGQNLKARGFTLEGDGPGLTFISFAPGAGTKYLFYNRAYLNVTIRGINFFSADISNRFMYSNSTPPGYATQRYSFEHCHWSGSWDRGFFLEGANNNSEWAFVDCGVSGQMNTFFQIPSTNASDQFLNFWFTRMKFWPTATTGSNFIDMAMGGSISISDSDFSGLRSGLLFALRGNIHSYGVQRFACRDSRFELKSSTCKVLFSEWADGDVVFDGCDFGSQANEYSRDSTTFTLRYNGVVKGPAYRFANCTLIGKVAVSANSSDAFRMKNSVLFDQCQFPQFRMIENAFVFSNPTTNSRGRIPVRIRDSQPGGSAISSLPSWTSQTSYAVGTIRRSNNKAYVATTAGVSGFSSPNSVNNPIVDSTVVWEFLGIDSRSMPGNMTLNGLRSVGSNPVKNYIIISDPGTGIPPSGLPVTVMLPPDAVVTGLNVFSPAGAGNASAATFRLQTSEANPTEVYTFTAPSYSAGVNDKATMFYPVGSDMGKRTLVFSCTSTGSSPNGIVVLEYLN